MELLFAISVVLGACLLGSFLGKAFVALIQKFSGDYNTKRQLRAGD